jgi:diguanylate cyclase (GGDEF)-like protein
LPDPQPRQPLAALQRLDQARPAVIVAASLGLLLAIALADYLTSSEISLTLFYVLPIALLAWYVGWRWGAFGGLLATGLWLLSNVASGLRYSSPAVYVWNSLMRLGTYEVVVYLFAALRQVLQHEQQLARTDFITGAVNSRAFYDVLQAEVARANRYRHPLTLGYLDLDDFKSVNDRLGHSVGDAVLRALVSAARGVLRASDVVARVGGDEFVLLLPETGAAEARPAVEKVQRAVLDAMRANGWPVTVSLGVLVCTAPLPNADSLVRAADDLMYVAKRAGKNALHLQELAGQKA